VHPISRSGRCGIPVAARSYSPPIKTFIYLHCRDLELARSFYSNVLGLMEIDFSAEEGAIAYQVGALQITISTHADAVHIDGWAKQLGWEGGSASTPSWGIEFAPSQFRRAIESARVAGLDAHYSEPRWVGYWSFPVKDPMGYTVEISTSERDAWPPSN
jgi:catechol 2,3-dioxygenase-like lactoylglutathione lyase family enzyme